VKENLILTRWLLSCFSCSKELGQWDLLMEFGKTKGHANPFLGKFMWHFIVSRLFISCVSYDQCKLWTNFLPTSVSLKFLCFEAILRCVWFALSYVWRCCYLSVIHVIKLLYFSYFSAWERMASPWVVINEGRSSSGAHWTVLLLQTNSFIYFPFTLFTFCWFMLQLTLQVEVNFPESIAYKLNLYRGYIAICHPDDQHLNMVCTIYFLSS